MYSTEDSGKLMRPGALARSQLRGHHVEYAHINSCGFCSAGIAHVLWAAAGSDEPDGAFANAVDVRYDDE